MKENVQARIAKALVQAETHGLPQEELWLGPTAYQELISGGSGDVSQVVEDNGKSYFRYKNLRLRRAYDEVVRVGVTTCEWGPGVT